MRYLPLATNAVALGIGSTALADGQVNKAAVLGTYADIAAAGYTDSLITAQRLQRAVQTLVEAPSAEALNTAKTA